MWHVSCYKFFPLNHLEKLKQTLKYLSDEYQLCGTVIIAYEGINISISGEEENVHAWFDKLLQILPEIADIPKKITYAQDRPFNRMLVKIKKEIISFGVEGIDPFHRPAPRIHPQVLCQWLTDHLPILLLDTRNDYEIKLGTFITAMTLSIQHFRDFVSAIDKIPQNLRHLPVVTFCTGGIRCEKAAPYLQQKGFNVLQLDGGILGYFELCGGEHYLGECFVFDKRVGLYPNLKETDSKICYTCQTPLTTEDQQSPQYKPAISCPYCVSVVH